MFCPFDDLLADNLLKSNKSPVDDVARRSLSADKENLRIDFSVKLVLFTQRNSHGQLEAIEVADVNS